MNEPVLTPTEWERVRAYDEQCQQEIEAAGRPPVRPDFIKDLCDALEKEAMEDIKDLTTDIGVLLRCRETFKDRSSVENTNVLIWMLRYKIEGNHDDITRWRSYKKESCRV
jgi:hypothetical protein